MNRCTTLCSYAYGAYNTAINYFSGNNGIVQQYSKSAKAADDDAAQFWLHLYSCNRAGIPIPSKDSNKLYYLWRIWSFFVLSFLCTSTTL